MITTSQILSRIRNTISDQDPAGETFPDSELTDHLGEVVLEYSSYRPVPKRTSFLTVASQDIYEMSISGVAPDLAWVDRIYNFNNAFDMTYFFNTTGVYATVDVFTFMRYMSVGDRNLFKIRDDLLDLYNSLGQAVGAQYDATHLILYPAPNLSGVQMNLDYFALHVADSSGNYPTIPSQDQIHILRLMEAKLLDIIATEFSKKGDYAQGQTKVTYNADKFRSRAQALRAQVLTALEESVIGRG
jgi:hypothetical protein